MEAVRISELVARLAQPGGRAEAAAALARRLGAEEVIVLVRDPALGVLLPAPGFPQTLRGGASWRSFLSRCEYRAGSNDRGLPLPMTAEVELPEGRPRSALALPSDPIVLVVLGGDVDQPAIDTLAELLPLLGASLRLEQELVLGKAEVSVAQEAASRARTLAAALESARAEASRLNVELRAEHRRKDDFLAMLAHELRNPLAPVVATIELLRRQGSGTEDLPRHLEVMTRQVSQLARLVDDLLDVARVSHGRIELRRSEVELQAALSEAIETSRPLLEARRHVLELDLPEQPLWVSGDSARLTQVFSNLLHNAAKYTNDGGMIEIAARRESRETAEGETQEAVVRIRDSGVGIAEDALPQIFDLFNQAPRSRDRTPGGLGIGLTLVRSLVELHGGEVVARSGGLGEGSEFTVRLPLSDGTAAPDPEEDATVSAAATAAPKSLRVLVVDDNEDAATAIAEILGLMGHRAETAYGGLTALQVASDLDPDLVLLDIGLPDLDGYEVARRMRRLMRADARLVALSGYGSPEDKRRSHAAGFDEHLTKPLVPERLRALLADCAG